MKRFRQNVKHRDGRFEDHYTVNGEFIYLSTIETIRTIAGEDYQRRFGCGMDCAWG